MDEGREDHEQAKPQQPWCSCAAGSELVRDELSLQGEGSQVLTRNADSFVTKVMKIKQDLADASSELEEWQSRRMIRPEMGLNLDEDDGLSTISSFEN